MLKKRILLWWLMIIGVILHMYFMTNINIAILSMVKNTSQLTENITQNNEFDWNEQQKSMVYGAFYWFAWASQLFGGVLSHKYGSKITFGLSNFIGCLLCSVIPLAANFGWEAVVAVRVIQGAIGSVGLPAGIMTIIGNWAPPDERGKFVSVFLGFPLGISTGYTFFGFIADYLGWEYVFHSTTILGIAWYSMWYFFVFDSPDQHPRISEKEKIYITKSLENSGTKEKLPIPWKEIFTSRPLLLNIICSFGQAWAFLATSIYIPKYLKTIHGISLTKIGTYTGVVFLAKAVLQIFGGVATDFMIKRGMSKTRVRNIVVLFATVMAGALLSSVKLVEYDVFWSSTLLLGYFLLSSFTSSGAMVAVIDMAPNFCGVIQGIICGLYASTGFFCSLEFKWLSVYFDELEIWGYFFLTCGLMSVVPGILFILFSNSELQPWNEPKKYSGEVLKNLDKKDDA